LSDGHPHQTDRIADQNPFQNGDGYARETFLDRHTGRRVDLEASDVGGHVLHHHGGEERLLVGEAGIDGRLPGTRYPGNLINTGAVEAAFEKGATGRVENPTFYFSGELSGRAADADRMSPSGAPLRCCSPRHAQPSRSRYWASARQHSPLI